MDAFITTFWKTINIQHIFANCVLFSHLPGHPLLATLGVPRALPVAIPEVEGPGMPPVSMAPRSPRGLRRCPLEHLKMQYDTHWGDILSLTIFKQGSNRRLSIFVVLTLHLRKHKICLHFSPFLNIKTARVIRNFACGGQGSVCLIWSIPWLLMTWDIKSHSIELVLPEYPGFSTRRVKRMLSDKLAEWRCAMRATGIRSLHPTWHHRRKRNAIRPTIYLFIYLLIIYLFVCLFIQLFIYLRVTPLEHFHRLEHILTLKDVKSSKGIVTKWVSDFVVTVAPDIVITTTSGATSKSGIMITLFSVIWQGIPLSWNLCLIACFHMLQIYDFEHETNTGLTNI